MEKPLTVSFRGFDATPELRDQIDKYVERLERHCDHIIGCDVAVELKQKSARGNSGANYRVRLAITVPPSHEIIAEEQSADSDAAVPLLGTLRDAFESAERQLDKLTAKQRGDVKAHPEQSATATVTKLFAVDRYGFILTEDGRELYFRDTAVQEDRFEDLEIGAAVHFHETSADEGPVATTIRLVDKRGGKIPMETG
ncbi:MAG: HPF/RaiA family ribosome-associated protein [Opitutales bacterium]